MWLGNVGKLVVAPFIAPDFGNMTRRIAPWLVASSQPIHHWIPEPHLEDSIEHQAPNDPQAVEDAPSWVGAALRASQQTWGSAILSYCRGFFMFGGTGGTPKSSIVHRISVVNPPAIGGSPSFCSTPPFLATTSVHPPSIASIFTSAHVTSFAS